MYFPLQHMFLNVLMVGIVCEWESRAGLRLPPHTRSIAVATAVIASAEQLIIGQSCLWSSAFPFSG